ncbi:cell wall elongation regulator TseB-like domain-containing protein [Streptococcus suis]
MEKKISQLLTWIGTVLGQFVVGISLFITVLTFSIFIIWDISSAPYVEMKQHATQVARDYADIQTVETFSIYNSSETYYSIIGADSEGQSLAVIIPENSNTVFVYPMENGISKDEAQAIAKENGAGAVEKVVLGYKDGKPIWEVKSGTAYYLVEFETGSFVKKEGL